MRLKKCSAFCVFVLIGPISATADVCNQPGVMPNPGNVGGEVIYRNTIEAPSLEGLPVTGMQVRLKRFSGNHWELVQTTQTGSAGIDKGKFCFRGLANGQHYRLEFSKDGHFATTAETVDWFTIQESKAYYFHLHARKHALGVYGAAALWALDKIAVKAEGNGIQDEMNDIRGFDFAEVTLASPISNPPPLCALPYKQPYLGEQYCVHPGNPAVKINGKDPNDQFYTDLFSKLRQPYWKEFLPVVQARIFTSEERRGAAPAKSAQTYLQAIQTVLQVTGDPGNPFQYGSAPFVLQLDEEIVTGKLSKKGWGWWNSGQWELKPTGALLMTNYLYGTLRDLTQGNLAISQSYAPGWCNSYPFSSYAKKGSGCQTGLWPGVTWPAMKAHSILAGGFFLTPAQFKLTLDSAKAYKQSAENPTPGTGTYAQIHFDPMRPLSSENVALPLTLDCEYWNESYRLTAYQQIKRSFDEGVPVMLFWEGLQAGKVSQKGFVPAWGWNSTDPAMKKFKEDVLNRLVPELRKRHRLPFAKTISEVPSFMPMLIKTKGSLCE